MQLVLKQCKRCGKMFIPAAEHLYKLPQKVIENNKEVQRIAYYCSYKCWRKDGGDNGSKQI